MKDVVERQRQLCDAEYPASYVLRIAAVLIVGAAGWTVWVISLTMSKIYVDGGLIGGSIGLDQFWIPIWFKTPSVVWVFWILYCVSIIGAWWPVLSRPHFVTCWFWRCASFGFIMPVYVLFQQREYMAATGRPSPGPACATWAVGSVLMGLAVWLSPRRIRGEPSSGAEVLWRVWRGRPIVTFNAPRADRAFPLIDDVGGAGR